MFFVPQMFSLWFPAYVDRPCRPMLPVVRASICKGFVFWPGNLEAARVDMVTLSITRCCLEQHRECVLGSSSAKCVVVVVWWVRCAAAGIGWSNVFEGKGGHTNFERGVRKCTYEYERGRNKRWSSKCWSSFVPTALAARELPFGCFAVGCSQESMLDEVLQYIPFSTVCLGVGIVSHWVPVCARTLYKFNLAGSLTWNSLVV